MSEQFRTVQDLRNLDVQVGRLLGFNVRTEAETGDIAFVNREWEREWIEYEDDAAIELPRYSLSLECAWQLLANAARLFKYEWLSLEPREVALNICLAFVNSRQSSEE